MNAETRKPLQVDWDSFCRNSCRARVARLAPDARVSAGNVEALQQFTRQPLSVAAVSAAPDSWVRLGARVQPRVGKRHL